MRLIIKRILLVGVLAILFTGMLPAEEAVLWGSNYMKGNIIPGGAIALESGPSYRELSLGLYPSAEMILFKPQIAGFSFLDLGAAVDGRIGLPLRESAMTAGIAVEGTLHFGFRGFDFPGSEYLDPLDFYTRIGVAMDFLSPDGFQAGLAVSSGVNYFLNDRLMVGAGYTGWRDNHGMSLQVRYRLGKTPVVKGMAEVWEAGEEVINAVDESIYLAQFYTFFFLGFYSGGNYWAPDTYKEGEGTLWKFIEEKDNESFFMERTLIQRTPEGSEWWRLRYYDETEEVVYEFQLTSDQQLVSLYYENENGRIRERHFEGEEDENLSLISGAYVVEASTISELSNGNDQEDVTVPAGTFVKCDVINQAEDNTESTWWFTGEKSVPGRTVKSRIKEDSNILNVELQETFHDREGAFQLKID
jgi:hypothetical protein